MGARTTGVSITSASGWDGELSRSSGSSLVGVVWVALIDSRLDGPRKRSLDHLLLAALR